MGFADFVCDLAEGLPLVEHDLDQGTVFPGQVRANVALAFLIIHKNFLFIIVC